MSDLYPAESPAAMAEAQRRDLAIRRIKARHDFRIHLVAYIVVNAALVVIWYLTSQDANGALGFFWPILPIAGWGIGLALHAYVAFVPPSLTEDDIRREMKRLQ